MTTYNLTNTTNSVELTLSRTGSQGSKGDSISTIALDSNNDTIVTIVDGGGNTINTINLGGSALVNQLNDFKVKYLGSKTSAPSANNEGGALIDGALFFNTTTNELGVYDLTTTTWEYPALEAATSATNAASSATTASASATSSTSSATNAASSATNAATSESNAATSATSSATSATNAASSATAANTSASNASTSESNAATSATNAAASATAVTNSASNAATSATNAASSATAAASSSTAAQTAQAAAELAFDNFDDKFLGTKSSDPTADNDGNTLVEGAMYYHSGDNVIKFYNGSAWEAPSVTATNAATSATTSATNAATSATSASSSATTAATSETNASSSASAAATSASAASTSASNSATSASAANTAKTSAETAETNAAASATNAATSETNAATSETNAATSATNASTSATSAATSATNTATLYDSFDDRYLGAKSSDPSVDNDGDALITGALCFNTSLSSLRVYNGSAWVEAGAGVTVQASAPTSGLAEGDLWYDTTNDQLKAYNGTAWVGTGFDNIAALSDVTLSSAASGEILKYNGSVWINNTLVEAGIQPTLTAGTNVTIAANGTISSTDTNTTYSIGDGGLTTNDFTNADHTKLNSIEASADVTDTANVVAALTAGSNITIAADGTIAGSAAPYSHPNHTGEVTSAGDGATVIADNVVDEANLKVSNTPTNGKVLTAQSGNTGGLTWADPVSQPTAMQTKTEFTATAGQTTFTVSYTPNAVNVYRNGVRLQSSDFTATTGTTIVLDDACTVGDSLEIEAFTVSGIVAKSTVLSEVKFTATQGQTSFSLTYDVGGVFVFLNGIKLQDSDYTATSGSAIVLASGANAGDILDIQKFVVESVHAQAAVLSELEFTATANQTTFTANYTVGAIEVFLNGVRLQAADYTATNGTSIVLATGATVGDILSVQKFTVSSLYTLPTSSYTETEFTATAGQTTFTHSYDVGGVTVYLNGVKLQASDYAATNGSSIVLTTGATAGDILTVQKFTVAAVNAQLAVRTAQEFTATANQTTFNFSYTAGAIDVYLNGIKLPDSDYTATNGTTVVLDTGAQAGSVLEIVKYTVGSLDAAAAVITNAAFTATANQTTFTTAYTPNQVEVFLNGLKLPDADYTASNGSSIVLAVGAQAGDSVEVQKYTISDINSVSIAGDVSPTLGGNLDTNNKSITSASNNNVDLDPDGSGTVVFKGNSTKGAGQFKLNCENNSHGITIKGPPHSAGASYTLTLPNNDGDASQVLTSNGSGVTSWATPAAGAMEFIASSGAISNVANVSFTGFDASKYDHYQFHMQHIMPSTDGASLFAHASTDGGSSYDTTSGNYHTNQVDRTGFHITDGLENTGGGESGVSGVFYLYAPHVTDKYTYGLSQSVMMVTVDYVSYLNAQTAHLAAQDTDAIQFKFSSGNIASGEIVMYGIRNS